MTSDVLLACRAARRERQYMYMPGATRYVLATPSAWVRHAVVTRTPASFLLHRGSWTARGLSGLATNYPPLCSPLGYVCQKSVILLVVWFPSSSTAKREGYCEMCRPNETAPWTGQGVEKKHPGPVNNTWPRSGGRQVCTLRSRSSYSKPISTG